MSIVKINISRSKLKTSELERAKLLYLVNPMQYKMLASLQGQNIHDMADLIDLYGRVEDGESNFNFKKVRNDTPAYADKIRNLKDRIILTV